MRAEEQRIEALRTAFYQEPTVASWQRAVAILSSWPRSAGADAGLDCALEHIGRWGRATLVDGLAMPEGPIGVWQLVEMRLDQGPMRRADFEEDALMRWQGPESFYWPPTGALGIFHLSLTSDGRFWESALCPTRVPALSGQTFDDASLDFVSDCATRATFSGRLTRHLPNDGVWRRDRAGLIACADSPGRGSSGRMRLMEGAVGNVRALDVLAWDPHTLWRTHCVHRAGGPLRVFRLRYAPTFALASSRVAGRVSHGR